jgi:hypothetical protein
VESVELRRSSWLGRGSRDTGVTGKVFVVCVRLQGD